MLSPVTTMRAGFLESCHFLSHRTYRADGSRFTSCQKKLDSVTCLRPGALGMPISPMPSISADADSESRSSVQSGGFMGNFITFFS